MESVGADPRRLRWRWPRAVGQSRRSTAIARVEEHERVVRPLGQLGLEDLAIELKLAFPQRRVGVAGVRRTVTSVHRTGTFTRRKAGKIGSCTA